MDFIPYHLTSDGADDEADADDDEPFWMHLMAPHRPVEATELGVRGVDGEGVKWLHTAALTTRWS